MGARKRTARDELLIQQCSHVVPSVVLQDLLGVSSAAFTRWRKELGVKLSLSESKKITSKFLAEDPELNELPLNDEERKHVLLYRHSWRARRNSKTGDDRQAEVIRKAAALLPTRAIAAILEVPVKTVLRLQKELEVPVERATRRRLEHQFSVAEEVPSYDFLSVKEAELLRVEWEAVRKEQQARTKTKRSRANDFAAKKLKKLEEERAAILASDPDTELSPCSGNCGESWPRRKAFFTPNWRREDGLSDRCKYCDYLHRSERKLQGGGRKNKAKGRTLSQEEELRLSEIVGEYSDVIPGILFRHLFRIGEGTLSHLRKLARVKMSMPRSKKIFWRWYFRSRMPEFPLLSDVEIARLYLMTRRLDEHTSRHFERDREHEAFLRTEALRFLEEKDKSGKWDRCRLCKSEYPAEALFFRKRNDTLEPRCKVCVNHQAARRRKRRLKERFGEL